MTTPSHSRRLLAAEGRGEAWEVSGINHQSQGSGQRAVAGVRPARPRVPRRGGCPAGHLGPWRNERRACSHGAGVERGTAFLGCGEMEPTLQGPASHQHHPFWSDRALIRDTQSPRRRGQPRGRGCTWQPASCVTASQQRPLGAGRPRHQQGVAEDWLLPLLLAPGAGPVTRRGSRWSLPQLSRDTTLATSAAVSPEQSYKGRTPNRRLARGERSALFLLLLPAHNAIGVRLGNLRVGRHFLETRLLSQVSLAVRLSRVLCVCPHV